MLILVFYFPAIGKIKGACNTSSLPTAVAPILAETAPPALSHQLDWGNKKILHQTQGVHRGSTSSRTRKAHSRNLTKQLLTSSALDAHQTMRGTKGKSLLYQPPVGHWHHFNGQWTAGAQAVSATPRLQRPYRNPYGSSRTPHFLHSEQHKKRLG